MSMRAFVALEISGRAADSLVDFEKELLAAGADIKFVERENLHLNLRFLGEVTDAQAAEVQSRLGRLAMKGAEVVIRGVGAFPSPSRPRVIWAGVAQEHEGHVTEIARQVIESLEGIGERDDRPFRAHVTLGRVRSGRNMRELGELLHENSGREFGTVILSEVKLKSSVLTPNGPVYRDAGVFRLS